MLSMYPACFFKEEKGYFVIFPDLDHLATCGDAFEDAMSMAQGYEPHRKEVLLCQHCNHGPNL